MSIFWCALVVGRIRILTHAVSALKAWDLHKRHIVANLCDIEKRCLPVWNILCVYTILYFSKSGRCNLLVEASVQVCRCVYKDQGDDQLKVQRKPTDNGTANSVVESSSLDKSLTKIHIENKAMSSIHQRISLSSYMHILSIYRMNQTIQAKQNLKL